VSSGNWVIERAHGVQARSGARWLRRAVLLLAGGVLLAALALIGPAWYIDLSTAGARYDNPADVPPAATAIVFGAGLLPDGRPSPLLADRVHAAVQLYQVGKVTHLLLSGDGESPGHDEPAAMAAQAESEGVPASAISEDPGGVRTYDSCSRAHDLFGVRSAVVVSQSYHLPRAVYTCRGLGIDASGYSFARVAYADDFGLRVREVLSRDRAFWQLLGHKIGL
jgi:vancomycin permeability regulator SanA